MSPRLAKLLSQWEPGPRVWKMDDNSFRGSLPDPRPPTRRGDGELDKQPLRGPSACTGSTKSILLCYDEFLVCLSNDFRVCHLNVPSLPFPHSESMHRCLSTPPASHHYGPDEVGGPKTPSTLPSFLSSPLPLDDLWPDQTLAAQRPDLKIYSEKNFSRLACSERRPQGRGAPKSLVSPLQHTAASVCSCNLITPGAVIHLKS